jgi:hypothetical protein
LKNIFTWNISSNKLTFLFVFICIIYIAD